ncbi:hypothetical protein [Pedobacter frigidisoli]|nr:hypothetical protein [Pedobacter frigidisoli]
MKTQNTSKITKKTVFVYKSVKVQSGYQTNPTGDQSQTIATSFILGL